MIRNPYEILGVSEGASMDEIKRAYRRKAKECHPDLHPDDPKANEKMQQVNEAYNMLCNPDRYRQQSRPNPGQYGGYAGHGSQGYGNYANQGNTYQSGNWQYTWYDSSAHSDAWNNWQNSWQDQANGGQSNRNMSAFNPFRTVFKVIGGIMLFRFFMTLLRFGIFGFFF